MGVTGDRQLLAQLIGGEFFALLEEEGACGQVFGRRQAVERGGYRHDSDVEGLLCDLIERGESLGDQILMWREVIVGQGFPVRQQVHIERRVEEGDLFEQSLRIGGGGGDHGERTHLRCQFGDRQRVGRTVEWARAALEAARRDFHGH